MGLAVTIACGLVAGELVALQSTAERVVSARDQRQAPHAAAIIRHKVASAALHQAQVDQPTAAPTARLADATARLAAAEAAIRDQASTRSCAANCAALLKDAASAGRDEVAAARRELDDHQRREAARLNATVTAARAALDAAPLPDGSATPLADAIGVAPWIVDVVVAVLTSIAINVLGGAFIAAAAHGPATLTPAPQIAEEVEIARPQPERPASPPTLRLVGPDLEVGPIDLLLDLIEEAPGKARMEIGTVYATYVEACEAQGLHPMTPAAASKPLQALCKSRGIEWHSVKGKVYLSGIRRRSVAISA